MKDVCACSLTVDVSGPLWSRNRRAWSVVALRSGRSKAPLVGASGGSWSDFGVVGLRRIMAPIFFLSEKRPIN